MFRRNHILDLAVASPLIGAITINIKSASKAKRENSVGEALLSQSVYAKYGNLIHAKFAKFTLHSHTGTIEVNARGCGDDDHHGDGHSAARLGVSKSIWNRS